MTFSVIFIFIVGYTLFLKYKGKLTYQEKEARKQKEKEYIFTKLKQLEAINQKKSTITNLPLPDPFY